MNRNFGMVLKGTGALIAIYLLVSNSTGAGTLLTKTFDGSAAFARTLQGRK